MVFRHVAGQDMEACALPGAQRDPVALQHRLQPLSRRQFGAVAHQTVQLGVGGAQQIGQQVRADEAGGTGQQMARGALICRVSNVGSMTRADGKYTSSSKARAGSPS